MSLYNNPLGSISEASQNHRDAMAAYRFLGNDFIHPEAILKSHREAIIERLNEYDFALAVQDTTSINLTSMKKTKGLGPINTTKDKARGIHVHDTVVFSENGISLGVLDFNAWVRDETIGEGKTAHLPIEEKESYKWLKSYQQASLLQYRCPRTTIVSVGDRESDIYELFEETEKIEDGAKLLVRSEYSRSRKVLVGDGKGECLWEHLLSCPVCSKVDVELKARDTQPARTATLSLRYQEIMLSPPKGKNPLKHTLFAVYALEENAPQGASPLEWMLLTTHKVADEADAKRVLGWYGKRWGIEVFHKILKSGCKVESNQLNTFEKLKRCLALDMLVAWRIMFLCTQGRECPDLPCTVLLDEVDWKALTCYFNNTAKPPKEVPSLNSATRMIAQLGGFLGRKNDGHPGNETIWRGLNVLSIISQSWLRFSEMGRKMQQEA